MKNMRYVLMDEAGSGEGGGAGAGGAPEGIAGLSDELRSNPTLKDFKDVNALAQSLIETKKMVGNSVRIPGPDAGEADIQAFKDKLLSAELGVIPTPDLNNPEEAAKFFMKLGAPEEPTGYTKVEGMDPTRFDSLSKLAHQAGITDKQFKQVAGAMVQEGNSANEAILAERQQGIDSLKTEWGEAYAQKTARAQRLAEATKAPQGLIDAISNNAVDAGTLRWLDAVAAGIGGEGMNLKDIGVVTTDTKAELEEQRDELTRRLQSDERMPQSERERLIAKNVDINARILALTG